MAGFEGVIRASINLAIIEGDVAAYRYKIMLKTIAMNTLNTLMQKADF